MQMNDTQRISADRATVFAALNDPDVLRRCIPGCESLEMTSPTEMVATVQMKVGPVKAKFTGSVTLSEIDAPNGYRIGGQGSGGVAGFAKGGADVRLEETGANETMLHYSVDAQIGGKLAQLGSRLIDSTAKRLAGEFFENFAALVAPSQEPASDVATVAAAKPKGWLKSLVGGSALGISALAMLAMGNHACCIGQEPERHAVAIDLSAICRAHSPELTGA